MIVNRVQQLQISFQHKDYSFYDKLCFDCNSLRNKANYPLRNTYFENIEKYENNEKLLKSPSFSQLDKQMKKTFEYKTLPAKVANSTIKYLLEDWSAFWNSLKEYYKNPEKYKARPNPPGYKGDRYLRYSDGRSVAHLNYQTMSGGQKKKNENVNNCLDIVKNGKILLCSFSNDYKFEVPFNLEKVDKETGEITLRNVNILEIRVVPKVGYYLIEIVYTENINEILLPIQKLKENIGVMDLGTNNVCAMVFTGNTTPWILSGKLLKCINSFANKEISKAKRKLQKCKPRKIKRAEQKVRKAKRKLKHRELIKSIFEKLEKPNLVDFFEKKIAISKKLIEKLKPTPQYSKKRVKQTSSIYKL